MQRAIDDQIGRPQPQEDALANFRIALKSESTRKTYDRLFAIFLSWTQMSADAFASRALSDRRWTEQAIMGFLKSQEERVDKREIARATLKLSVYPLKLFCAMNDIMINWTKIQKMLPPGSKVANDRAPTIAEIKSLLKMCDIRMRALVLVMISSGIRIGAWNWGPTRSR